MNCSRCITLLFILTAGVLSPVSAQYNSAPLNSVLSFQAGFENDGLAPIPDAEWDNLDSYGFFLNGKISPKANFYTRIRGITNRGTGEDESSRIDLLHVGTGWTSDPLYRGSLILLFNGAFGIEAAGNFGMSSIQSSWHSTSGIYRPINSNYDSESFISPVLTGGLRVSHHTLEMIYFQSQNSISIDTMHMDFRAGINSMGIDISAGYDMYLTGTMSPTLKHLYESENGFYYNISTCSGKFRYNFNAHPFTGISKGSISLVINDECPDTLLETDFGIIVGTAPATTVQFSLPLETEWFVTPFISAALSGGWTQEKAAGDSAPRFTSYSAGTGVSRQLNSVISIRSGLTAGVTIDQLRTLPQEISAVVDSRTVIETGLSAEIRFVIPDIIGIGIRSEYCVPLFETSKPNHDFNFRNPWRFQISLISK